MYYSNVYSGAIYYGNNDYRDYIAHYGVKGMRWKDHLYRAIDAAGNYIYDTPVGKMARRIGGAISNATGYTAKREMNKSLAAARKATDNATYYRKAGQKATAGTYTRAASQHYNTARGYADTYKKSIAGKVDRTISAVDTATKPIREAAKAGYRTAKNAVVGAYNKVKSSKFGQAIGGLINRGKSLVNTILGYIPGTKQHREKVRTAETTKRAKERHKGVTNDDFVTSQARELEKANRKKRTEANKATRRSRYGKIEKRLYSRGLHPMG